MEFKLWLCTLHVVDAAMFIFTVISTITVGLYARRFTCLIYCCVLSKNCLFYFVFFCFYCVLYNFISCDVLLN
jgi:hypothetical protein